MDGWMDGWMGAYGLMDKWIDGRIDVKELVSE